MKAIVVSTKDLAGMNIKKCLIESGFSECEEEFENHKVYSLKDAKLYTIDEDTVYFEDVDKKIDASLFIFATRHQAKSGIKSFSMHVQGNFGKAEYGGRDSKLCVSLPRMMKVAMLKLIELNSIDFDVVQEATHHGPFLEKPAMFIEIGSSELEWVRKDAGMILAKTIMHMLECEIPSYEVAVGIGGLHTTPSFKSVILKSNYCIGQVCAKHNLQYLDTDLLKQMIARNVPEASIVLLDWKGLGKEKQRIIEMLDSLDIKWEKSNKVY
jgi:D-aminoacyl-tRNA deacylase